MRNLRYYAFKSYEYHYACYVLIRLLCVKTRHLLAISAFWMWPSSPDWWQVKFIEASRFLSWTTASWKGGRLWWRRWGNGRDRSWPRSLPAKEFLIARSTWSQAFPLSVLPIVTNMRSIFSPFFHYFLSSEGMRARFRLSTNFEIENSLALAPSLLGVIQSTIEDVLRRHSATALALQSQCTARPQSLHFQPCRIKPHSWNDLPPRAVAANKELPAKVWRWWWKSNEPDGRSAHTTSEWGKSSRGSCAWNQVGSQLSRYSPLQNTSSIPHVIFDRLYK